MREGAEREREALALRLLVGEIDPEGPRGRALLSADPRLRSLVEELRGLEARLGRGARFEEAVLGEALGIAAAAPGGEAGAGAREPVPARSAAAAPSTAQRTAPPRVPRRWLPLAAAAVLLAAAGLAWLLVRVGGATPDARGHDPVLGAGLELLAPLGPGSDLGAYRWSYELPAGGWYELEVRGAAAPSDAPALARIPDLRAPAWVAERERASTWKDIRWTVTAFDGTGRRLASAAASATR